MVLVSSSWRILLFNRSRWTTVTLKMTSSSTRLIISEGNLNHWKIMVCHVYWKSFEITADMLSRDHLACYFFVSLWVSRGCPARVSWSLTESIMLDHCIAKKWLLNRSILFFLHGQKVVFFSKLSVISSVGPRLPCIYDHLTVLPVFS